MTFFIALQKKHSATSKSRKAGDFVHKSRNLSCNMTGMQNILLYAHRGSTILAPESTLPAFEVAILHGADILEIDVRMSHDDQIVVFHDERVDRTCNGHGKIRDLSLKQLKKLDAGYRFVDPNGRTWRENKTRVLTLSELFELFPQTPVNIDIKDNSKEAALAVAGILEKADRYSTVNVGSFHSSALQHFRQRLPQVTTAATQAEVANLYFKRGLYKNPPFEYLQIPMHYMGLPLAGNTFISHAKKRGIKPVYWTINDQASMEKLISRGAAGFVTDRVDIAGKLLGKSRHK